jgi:pSer/pThr/pTyr-binding forkhead associated (FHA) protein
MTERERKRGKEDERSNLWEKIWRAGVELDANVNPP